jgi:glycosyltransferase involved in cell wall biosynthesis
LRALEAEGHETAIAARAFAPGAPCARPAYKLAVPDGLAYLPGRILRRDLRELRAARSLRDGVHGALADFRPDAVYERYALFRTEGVEEAGRAGLPVALEVNAPLAEEEHRFRGLRLAGRAAQAERRAWAGADLVVVPSRPLAERVRARGAQQVLVVGNAVDTERFGPRADSAEKQRRLGLEGRFVVGFAGSVKRWHDLDTLVDAVAALPAALRAALLVVGDGPERLALERRASARRLELCVTGAVPHEQVPQYLAAMNACFAGLPADPALHYFSPLKALEYLASGRPTVVAAAGDLASLADAGVALGYRPGDSADLCARLLELADDPALRARLAKRGRAHAERVTWRDAARRIVQALERLRSTAATA